HVDIYYKFLIIFDLMPDIQNCSDTDILGYQLIEGNDEYLAEIYIKIYMEQKKQLKRIEQNQIKKKIIDIVKQNTTENLEKLHRVIMDLLKLDDNFRDELLKSRQLLANTEKICN
ncbi:unnamed protein product, partial [marine sediment metagenome]